MSSIGTGVSQGLVTNMQWGCLTHSPHRANLSSIQYDLSAAQFSPDGRVFQIEYAGKAVDNSGYAARNYNLAITTLYLINAHPMSAEHRLSKVQSNTGIVLEVEKIA